MNAILRPLVYLTVSIVRSEKFKDKLKRRNAAKEAYTRAVVLASTMAADQRKSLNLDRLCDALLHEING